jgi:hypothetical protein
VHLSSSFGNQVLADLRVATDTETLWLRNIADCHSTMLAGPFPPELETGGPAAEKSTDVALEVVPVLGETVVNDDRNLKLVNMAFVVAVAGN